MDGQAQAALDGATVRVYPAPKSLLEAAWLFEFP